MMLSELPSMTAEELATEVAEMRKAASEILASPAKRRAFLRKVGLPVKPHRSRKSANR